MLNSLVYNEPSRVLLITLWDVLATLLTEAAEISAPRLAYPDYPVRSSVFPQASFRFLPIPPSSKLSTQDPVAISLRLGGFFKCSRAVFLFLTQSPLVPAPQGLHASPSLPLTGLSLVVCWNYPPAPRTSSPPPLKQRVFPQLAHSPSGRTVLCAFCVNFGRLSLFSFCPRFFAGWVCFC